MTTTINASTSSGLVNTADTSGILQLQTASTAAVTIDTSQNVGIGTASPANKLDAYDSSAKAAVLAHGYSVVGANANTNNGCVQVGANGSACARLDFDSVTGGTGTTSLYNIYAGPLTFGTANTERMRIDSSGNLLVGTTTNLATTSRMSILSVGDGIKIQIGNTYAGCIIGNTSGTASYYASLFYNNNFSSLVGSIVVSGSSTAFNTSSDYRLKENVKPMIGALDKVIQLKPCTYTWKSDGSEGEGFIAHELAEIAPLAVSGEKDAVNEDGSIKPQGIDTSFLVATLTAAIQEQQALITTLQTQVAALQAKVGA
jgi:Chaperone of endosialidase